MQSDRALGRGPGPGPRGEGPRSHARRGGPGAARCCAGRGRGGAGQGALVEPAALAALLQRGAHGYDLRRSIAELTKGEIEVDVGGLYRVLRRLEEEGFLESILAQGGGGPQRREYQLTPEGRELAEDWVWQLKERSRIAALLVQALEQTLSEHENEDAGTREEL